MNTKRLWLITLLGASLVGVSCSDKGETGTARVPFNPNSPIEVTDFYPDSGGIATSMLVYGKNFGADTTGLKVNFIDEDGVKHPAGLVSSNGEIIYCMVPSGLTYKRNIKLVVERTAGEDVYTGDSPRDFIYKTQTAVTTVIGQASKDNQPTKPGQNLSTTTLSAPSFLVLDDEDNIFIVERSMNQAGMSGAQCQKPDGKGSSGNFLRANLDKDEIVLLATDTNIPNAPTFSDEKGLKTVYIPEDSGMGYYALAKDAGYIPRKLVSLKDKETESIDKSNWKHSFVVNKEDHFIYTVMYKGQLVRINPRTRRAEILLNLVGRGQTDNYCMFSPVQPNRLFFCCTNKNEIWYVDVDKLEGKDKDNYHGEKYAGRACWEGKAAGTGWEDGLLKNAKFDNPRQIAFTSDGKMYIADVTNSCIRTIDTTLPADKATVNTAIGLPGAQGYKDGGPEIAKFNRPTGVAVSADGQVIYVADNGNRVIRQLSIQ